MAAVSNLVHAAPPAPPGPATYDTSGFKGNAGTLMVDTAGKTINCNFVNTGRLRAYSDPGNPGAPCITAPTIATQILTAPYFDSANTVQFNPAVYVGKDTVLFANNTITQGTVTIGAPFNWKPPSFGILSHQPLALAGGSLGQTYPLSGGQVRGYSTLYVPQPPVATGGQLYDLNGGTVTGGATLYH